MHVNASDWYLHGHQYDRRYDQVILHVVYNNDKPVFNANGAIPCLELKEILTSELLQRYTRLMESHSELPCDPYELPAPEQDFAWMRDRLLAERLTQRVQPFLNASFSDTQVLFTLILTSFGGNKNKIAFRSLAEKINWTQLERWRMRPELIELYVLMLSGLYDETVRKSELWRTVAARDFEGILPIDWITRGIRPSNQPKSRVMECAQLIKAGNLKSLSEAETVFDFSLWWSEELRQLKTELHFSPFLISSIAINAVVPYAFYRGVKTGETDWIDFAFSHLDDWRSEKNNVVNKFKRKGFKSLTAADSQAILQLYKQYCQAKKCLSCAVGTKLMRA
jgi:hypothetical protein